MVATSPEGTTAEEAARIDSEPPLPVLTSDLHALVASHAGLVAAVHWSRCCRENRPTLLIILTAPPLLLQALLADHNGDACRALGGLATHVSAICRAGAPAACVGTVVAGLADMAVTAGSGEGALDALGSAVQQQYQGAAGAGGIVAQLRSHERFVDQAESAIPAVLLRAVPGFPLQQEEPVEALTLLAASKAEVGEQRVTGAATCLATRVHARHAGDRAARARLCSHTLVQACAAATDRNTAPMAMMPGAPWREEIAAWLHHQQHRRPGQGSSGGRLLAREVLLALFTHSDLVAAALAAPDVGGELLRALSRACERGGPACVVEAIVSQGPVMEAVLAAPAAAKELVIAIKKACSSSSAAPELAALLLEQDEAVRLALSRPEGPRSLISALAGASSHGRSRAVEILLSKDAVLAEMAQAGRDVAEEVAKALREACCGGHSDAAAALLACDAVAAAVLSAPDHVARLVWALRGACAGGHARIVQQLIVGDACAPLTGTKKLPRQDDAAAFLLRDAAFTEGLLAAAAVAEAAGFRGHVRFLAEALQDACKQGCEGTVTALLANRAFRALVLERADGPGTLSQALRFACEAGCAGGVRQLLADRVLQAAMAKDLASDAGDAAGAPAAASTATGSTEAEAVSAPGLSRNFTGILSDACRAASDPGTEPRDAYDAVVNGLLGNAGFLRAAMAQGGGGARTVVRALGDACKWGGQGVVEALLRCETAKRAVVDPEAAGRAVELVWMVWSACREGHAGVLELLLADAEFVELMLGAGSGGVERLGKSLELAWERGDERVVAALLGCSGLAEAMAPFLPQQQQAAAVLDLTMLPNRLRILPGVELSLVNLTLRNVHMPLGKTAQFFSYSPGGRLVFHDTTSSRTVGLDVATAAAYSRTLPRPASDPGNQSGIVYSPGRYCFTLDASAVPVAPPGFQPYNTTTAPAATGSTGLRPATVCVNRVVFMSVHVVADVGVDNSAETVGVLYGGYVQAAINHAYWTETDPDPACITGKPIAVCVSERAAQLEAAALAAQAAAESGDSSGLSETDKMIVGVVVGVGGALILAAVVVGALVYRRRRRDRRERASGKGGGAASSRTSWRGDTLPTTGSVIANPAAGGAAANTASTAASTRFTTGGLSAGVPPQNGAQSPVAATAASADAAVMRMPETVITLMVGETALAAALVALGGGQEQEQQVGEEEGGAVAAGPTADDEGRRDGDKDRVLKPPKGQPASEIENQQQQPAEQTERTKFLDANSTSGLAAAGVGSGGDTTGGPARQQQSQQPQNGAASAAPAHLVPAAGAALNDRCVFLLVPVCAQLAAELEDMKQRHSSVKDVQLKITGVLGTGAHGTVYRGEWQGLACAVKVVVFNGNHESRKAALREAALCTSINHPNVAATYLVDLQPLVAMGDASAAASSGAAAGVAAALGSQEPTRLQQQQSAARLMDFRLYIIQEFCDAGPLRALIAARGLLHPPTTPANAADSNSGAPRSPRVRLAALYELALGIARALAHLHSKSIVHSDLTPNNILLKRDPSAQCGLSVKVADFGLSVVVPDSRTHLSNHRCGSPFYIAPEVYSHGQACTASDIFSFGVVLWELYTNTSAGQRDLATSRLQYDSAFPELPPTCPAGLRWLVIAALVQLQSECVQQ
eukprot:XP_001697004.1 predicted protein [Chlamydomonas reinhardtii]